MYGIDPKARQTGAVIVFNDGISKEQAEKILQKIVEQLESIQIQEFNPTMGHPAFYVP